MKQVIQSYKNGKITLEDVPAPACKGGGVLVQTVASLISVGTEKLMIEMGQKSLLGKARARPDLVRQAWAKAKKEGFFSVYKEAMSRLDEPIPLGYSAAGIVREVGQPGCRVSNLATGWPWPGPGMPLMPSWSGSRKTSVSPSRRAWILRPRPL